MTDTIDIEAELVKLSRVMSMPVEQLRPLAAVGWRDLRLFRNLVLDRFAESAEERFRLMAQAGRLVPIPIIAKLAPMYFEPRVCGAMGGQTEAFGEDRVIKLLSKLPSEFMADCAPYLDPRKVGGMAPKIPTDVLVNLAPIMIGRKEFITLGQFIDFVTPEMLAALLPVIDDAALLQIAVVAENKETLNGIIPLLPRARIANIIYAADALNLWGPALDLFGAVNAELRAMLADVAVDQDDSLLNSMLSAVHAEDLFSLLLPLTERMSRQSLQRFTQLKALHDPQIMAAIADAAITSKMWSGLLPMIPLLPKAALQSLGQAPSLADRSAIADLVNQALGAAQDHLGDVLPLVSEAPTQVRQLFADVLGSLEPTVFDRAVAAVAASGGLAGLLPLVPLLPPNARARVSAAAAGFDGVEMKAALVSANDTGRMAEMLDVAAAMPVEARTKALDIIAENAQDEDLLGVGLNDQDQATLWSAVLRLSDGVPAQSLQALADQAALLNLDKVLPTILGAAQVTGRWAEGFAILSGINRLADREGVTVPFTMQGELVGQAVERAIAMELPDSLWFVKPLLTQYEVTGSRVAKAWEDANIATSSAVLDTTRSVFEIQLGRIAEGIAPVRQLAETGPAANLVTDAAEKAGDLAKSVGDLLKGALKRD